MSLRKATPLISVVLSLFNEEEVLPELIRRLRASLDPLDIHYELIFVDDASTDRSFKILAEIAEADKRVKVLRTSRNFGSRHGVCYLAGIEYSKGDAIIYMDTDLQDPPELLPKMIEAWRTDDEAEVVHTTRLSRAGEPPLRLFLFNCGYRILRIFSEVEIPSNSGDFKLISRRVAKHLLALGEKRPYLRGLIPWLGFKQVTVYYDRQPRFRGKTKRPVLAIRAIDYFLSAVISFSEFPLKYCIALGFFVTLAALTLAVYALVCKFLNLTVPGSAGILIAVFLLSGIQFALLGMLGIYICSIHDQVKGRPKCIIDVAIGFDKE